MFVTSRRAEAEERGLFIGHVGTASSSTEGEAVSGESTRAFPVCSGEENNKRLAEQEVEFSVCSNANETCSVKTGPPCSPLCWTSGRSKGRVGPGRGLALPADGPQQRRGDVCLSAPDAKLTGIRSVSVRSGAALRQDKASMPAAAHASGAPVSCSEVRRISAVLRERAGGRTDGRADLCVAVVVCAAGRAQ